MIESIHRSYFINPFAKNYQKIDGSIHEKYQRFDLSKNKNVLDCSLFAQQAEMLRRLQKDYLSSCKICYQNVYLGNVCYGCVGVLKIYFSKVSAGKNAIGTDPSLSIIRLNQDGSEWMYGVTEEIESHINASRINRFLIVAQIILSRAT